MKKYLALVLALVMCVAALAGCGDTTPTTTQGEQNVDLTGTYDIKVWVAENIVDLTKAQIDEFNKTNGQGIVINATVEPVGEGDVATSMTTDVENGADLFGFAQDQTARLITAGALSKLGVSASKFVRDNNDVGSIAAVTSGDALYGYPMTSDNGYFMYYDKSVITEDVDITSLEALIAACEAANRNFSFELENSWYTISFFFATGCVSTWETDTAGNFIGVNDTINSAEGIIAAKGMQKLVTSKCYVNSSATTDFDAAVKSAVVVSGAWNYGNAKELLGDNFGVAELPSFEVDGKSYHLASYNGCKLMGVKPQADDKRNAVLNLLAQYLTGETCQMQRLTTEGIGWGPSNLAVQGSDAFKNDSPHLAALAAQNKYSVPQGQIPNGWWPVCQLIATSIREGKDIQTALNDYETALGTMYTPAG